jgi:glycine dehydrogenase
MLRKSLVTIKQLAALPRSTLATSVARNDQNKLSFTVNFFNN